MSALEWILVIIVLYIIGYPVVWVLGLIKEIGDDVVKGVRDRTRKKETKVVPTPSSEKTITKSDEEILNNPEFVRLIENMRPHYRWMTLAGGTDPLLHPLISFERDGRIILRKHGYDLYVKNIKEYYSGTKWEEREKALERFGEDLFGEYVDEMKKIISFEYIADHLIELEQGSSTTLYYQLTFSQASNLKDSREKDLFRRELQNTSIIKT